MMEVHKIIDYSRNKKVITTQETNISDVVVEETGVHQ